MCFSLVGSASWWLAERAMQPIHQSYQQMQQFTSNAAHELRTPLAAVQATVESALRLTQLSEPVVRDILTALNRQNQRLVRVEGSYYAPPLSVRSRRAHFCASGSRFN